MQPPTAPTDVVSAGFTQFAIPACVNDIGGSMIGLPQPRGLSESLALVSSPSLRPHGTPGPADRGCLPTAGWHWCRRG